jgi:hypothetical protein
MPLVFGAFVTVHFVLYWRYLCIYVDAYLGYRYDVGVYDVDGLLWIRLRSSW